MKGKIIEEIKNELFKRKEVKLEFDSDAAPSTQEILKDLTNQFSVSEEAIKIKGIHGKFGSKTFEITAYIYASKEDKEKTEVKTKQEKEAEKKIEADRVQAEKEAKAEAKATEEAAKEAAEAEKPADTQEDTSEIKSEEVKPEAKTE